MLTRNIAKLILTTNCFDTLLKKYILTLTYTTQLSKQLGYNYYYSSN